MLQRRAEPTPSGCSLERPGGWRRVEEPTNVRPSGQAGGGAEASRRRPRSRPIESVGVADGEASANACRARFVERGTRTLTPEASVSAPRAIHSGSPRGEQADARPSRLFGVEARLRSGGAKRSALGGFGFHPESCPNRVERRWGWRDRALGRSFGSGARLRPRRARRRRPRGASALPSSHSSSGAMGGDWQTRATRGSSELWGRASVRRGAERSVTRGFGLGPSSHSRVTRAWRAALIPCAPSMSHQSTHFGGWTGQRGRAAVFGPKHTAEPTASQHAKAFGLERGA